MRCWNIQAEPWIRRMFLVRGKHAPGCGGAEQVPRVSAACSVSSWQCVTAALRLRHRLWQSRRNWNGMFSMPARAVQGCEWKRGLQRVPRRNLHRRHRSHGLQSVSHPFRFKRRHGLVHLQQGLHRTRRKRLRGMRSRALQVCEWLFTVRPLSSWNLHERTRSQRVFHLSAPFRVSCRQRLGHGLYMHSRIYLTKQ
jgi:hypothetical protein